MTKADLERVVREARRKRCGISPSVPLDSEDMDVARAVALAVMDEVRSLSSYPPVDCRCVLCAWAETTRRELEKP